MKETNMEHYRGEIEKIINAEFCDDVPAVVDGKPILCSAIGCRRCDLNGKAAECSLEFIKWLMSEYKPEPVLTQREKGFVECIRHGWVAADEVGSKMWYEDKPKKDKEPNEWIGKKIVTLNDDYFPFITWEDEEPWAVSDLRKLKALEYNPEDVAFKDGDLVVIDTTNNKRYGLKLVKEGGEADETD